MPDSRKQSFLDMSFDMINDVAKLKNTIANSNQIFTRLNFFQSRAISYEKQIADLYAQNWIVSKSEIQAVSGYVCNKCNTFSLRPIIDIGHDMTMQAKHRCVHGDKSTYIVFSIPPNIENIDEWTSQVLLYHLNFYIPIGKYLAADDMSRPFNAFNEGLNSDIAYGLMGIPDRYPLYSFEKDYKIDWVDRAITNLGRKIVVEEHEMLDFFRRVKSTYAIFEIPVGSNFKRILMRFTR